MLTDLYQITMVYAYWKQKRHEDESVFELFFRKNPFGGEYTIFCGLDEILKHLSTFKFSKSDIDYLRSTPALTHCEPEFFDDYLANLDCSSVRIYSMQEGRMVFPRVPLLTIVAPLAVGQIIETTLLTLVNFPSLVATNACRMVLAAKGQASTGGKESNIKMVEFGTRRAQGPDGAFSASKYSIMGGFDGTSNVLAGKLLGVPISGTHAHAFVQAHISLDEVKNVSIMADGEEVFLLPRVLKYRDEVFGGSWKKTNDGELAAFISYGGSFPDAFLCLIDTFDTLESGCPNFIMVAMVLNDLGHTPKGVRLDSGDLSYLSLECTKMFHQMSKRFDREFFLNLDIVASNDINEDVLHSLHSHGHAITVFGVGTNLVTCQAQPALGCVYKLVEIHGESRIKISETIEKILIPGRKEAYRLYGEKGYPLLDLMVGKDEDPPKPGERIICRHPFEGEKRCAVTPKRVLKLHELVFDKEQGVVGEVQTIDESRKFVTEQIDVIDQDVVRRINPAAYKVSVSEKLFRHLHTMWQENAPIREIF